MVFCGMSFTPSTLPLISLFAYLYQMLASRSFSVKSVPQQYTLQEHANRHPLIFLFLQLFIFTRAEKTFLFQAY